MVRTGNVRLEVCVTEAYGKPRKPRTPPFRRFEQQAVYDEYIDGATMRSIADLYQCSTHKISRAIHREHRIRARESAQKEGPL